MPIFVTQSNNNLIGSLFKCFFCCNKTNRYVEQNSNTDGINEHNKHLLDREYAKLKKHKIHANTRLFYQRIMENLEIIISENMIEKNILDYKKNARQSKFDNSDNKDHVNLFIRLSEAIYSLMENKKLTFSEKISLITNFSNNIISDTYSYSESQRIFIFEIFSSIIDYIYLDDHIKKTIRYNMTNTFKIPNVHIHNLFIDGKISYKDYSYYKYDIDNKGPFATCFAAYNRKI